MGYVDDYGTFVMGRILLSFWVNVVYFFDHVSLSLSLCIFLSLFLSICLSINYKPKLLNYIYSIFSPKTLLGIMSHFK